MSNAKARLCSRGWLKLFTWLLLLIRIRGKADLQLLIVTAVLLAGRGETIQGVKQGGLVLWLRGDDQDLSGHGSRWRHLSLRARGGEDRGLV